MRINISRTDFMLLADQQPNMADSGKITVVFMYMTVYLFPACVAVDDGEGGITYIENLGENMGEEGGTVVAPYVVSYAWGFAKPSMFDADFIKLREISLSYHVPRDL